MSEINQMRTTGWLALRLGLSVTTIERLRARGSQDLPLCHTIGKSIRYDEGVVEQFIRDGGHKSQPAPSSTKTTDTPPNTITTQEGEQHGND